MFLFFDAYGHPLTRRIDPVSPHPGQMGLHSVYPEGLPHFDMFTRFNPDVVFEPMPLGAKETEHGHNALSWGKIYQDEYVEDKKYFFKTVGPRDEREIENYFLGKHWKETLVNVMREDVAHCHSNVEIGCDPKIVELFARKALAKIGWTVERVVPCVYDVHGVYTGKLVFLLGQPEEVFNIAWVYNPDVMIQRATKGWVFDTPGFDNFLLAPYEEEIAKTGGKMYNLTDAEVAAIGNEFKAMFK